MSRYKISSKASAAESCQWKGDFSLAAGTGGLVISASPSDALLVAEDVSQPALSLDEKVEIFASVAFLSTMVDEEDDVEGGTDGEERGPPPLVLRLGR